MNRERVLPPPPPNPARNRTVPKHRMPAHHDVKRKIRPTMSPLFGCENLELQKQKPTDARASIGSCRACVKSASSGVKTCKTIVSRQSSVRQRGQPFV